MFAFLTCELQVNRVMGTMRVRREKVLTTKHKYQKVKLKKDYELKLYLS